MANLYCPNCGPIRTTMMRSFTFIDLNSLPPGPVPRSKCGRCGSQLYVGLSSSHRFPGVGGEIYRPFVVGTIIGCILWSITGGLIHAYAISPDWGAMGQNAISSLIDWRPLISLICTGLVYGLSVEIAKFLGAVFRSEGAILILPIIAGSLIGALQGKIVDSNLWGFPAETVFRGEILLVLSGALCGAILSYPTVFIGMAIRRRGTPW